MQSDFTFVLHCSNCGLKDEIDEYTLRYPCPECRSEMKLSYIKVNIPVGILKNRLSDLQLKKAHGDFISGRIFALLADSADPAIRNLVEEVVYEKYCRDHGITLPKSAAKFQPHEPARSAGKKGVTCSPSRVQAQGSLASSRKQIKSSPNSLPKSPRSPAPPRVHGSSPVRTTPAVVPPPGQTTVVCPYCGTKKLISNSFIGLYTRCRCGRTFPTDTSMSRPVPVRSTSVKKTIAHSAGNHTNSKKNVDNKPKSTEETNADTTGCVCLLAIIIFLFIIAIIILIDARIRGIIGEIDDKIEEKDVESQYIMYVFRDMDKLNPTGEMNGDSV